MRERREIDRDRMSVGEKWSRARSRKDADWIYNCISCNWRIDVARNYCLSNVTCFLVTGTPVWCKQSSMTSSSTHTQYSQNHSSEQRRCLHVNNGDNENWQRFILRRQTRWNQKKREKNIYPFCVKSIGN